MIWYMPFKQQKQNTITVPKCFFIKKAILQNRNMCQYKKPYFYCLTPQGTAKEFLQALQKNKIEQAKNYLSHTLLQANIEEIKKILVYDTTYRFFAERKSKKMYVVTLASVKRKELVSFCMVAEPDDLGVWKILGIERK